ncbi:MAG: hypothetical protein AB7R89_21675 [Dehalococcoidia bacterium]
MPGPTEPTTREDALDVRAANWRRSLRPLRRWLPALLIGVAAGVGLTLLVQLLVSDGSSGLPEFTSQPPPDNPDVTVTLSYDLMSALIQRGIDSGEIPVPLTNIRSGNSNGRLLIRGDFTIFGQTVSGSVELEPYVENGTLKMLVRRAQVGRLPVPSNLDRLAEDPLNRQLASALGGLPATVTSAAIDEFGITVTADVRTDEIPITPR